MSNYMGIDIGYSNVKSVFGNGEDAPSSTVFPVGAMRSEDYKEIFMNVGGDAVPITEVDVDGVAYSVGFEPAKVQGLNRNVTENYVDSAEYKALFYGALIHSESNHVDRLVTGLPVNQFKDADTRQRVIDLMKGEHKVAPKRTITVGEVEVIPQPGGALMGVIEELERNEIKSESGNEELAEMMSMGSTLVIDPGFYSLDYVTFSEGALDHSISGTSLLASSRVMERAAVLISKDVGSPAGKELRREKVEEAIRKGREKIMHYSVKVNVNDYVDRASQYIGDSAIKEISGNLRDTNIDVVVIAGGGSSLFRKSVEKEFHDQKVVMSSSPVRAIAMGYYYWASRS